MDLRWIAFMALLPFLPIAHAASAGPCDAHMVEDAEGDVLVWPGMDAPDDVDTRPLDVVHLRLSLEDDELHYEARLAAAPPRGEATEKYRYWFGFEVQGNGDPMYMDLRLHDGPDYKVAHVLAPNAYGNIRLGEAAALWDNGTVRFEVPLKILREGLALPGLTAGNPRASTDGPHRVPSVGPASAPQGIVFAAPYMTDRAGDGNEYRPLRPCEDEDTGPQDANALDPRPGPSVPMMWAVGTAAGAAVAGLAVGRRRRG